MSPLVQAAAAALKWSPSWARAGSPPQERDPWAVYVSRTFLEVNVSEAVEDEDEEPQSVPRSKTLSDLDALSDAGAAPCVYVDDGTSWRKAADVTHVRAAPRGSLGRLCLEGLGRRGSSPAASSSATTTPGISDDGQPAICRTPSASPCGMAPPMGHGFGAPAPWSARRRPTDLSLSDDGDLEASRQTTPGAFSFGSGAAEERGSPQRRRTAAQRTNWRRAEKRRQRRVAAEVEAVERSQAAPALRPATPMLRPATPAATPAAADAPRTWMTTVTLRSLPTEYSRAMLLELLDTHGFRARYDFVYLPHDSQKHTPLGFAFINFVHPDDAARCFQRFRGFRAWSVPCSRECVVDWHTPQGLAANIEKYRNTTLMFPSVAEERKPLLLLDGAPVPFPSANRRRRRGADGASAGGVGCGRPL